MSLADSVDRDLEAHMQCFLSALPGNLGLNRIQELDCSNPERTLGVLAEIQAAVQRERKKIQALEALARAEASPSLPLRQAAKMHAQRGGLLS